MNEDKRPAQTNTNYNLADEQLTQAVLESFKNTEPERVREIMQSLVKHMHAFIKDVHLTEGEWFKGIDYLTRSGHITDDKRQEFVLLSDVLGVSMLVIDINNEHSAATPNTVFGPFYFEGSLRFSNGDDIANGASGEPCFMKGRVLSTTGVKRMCKCVSTRV